MEWLTTAVLAAIILYIIYYIASRNTDYFEKRGFPCIKKSSWEEISDICSTFLKFKSILDIANETYKKANSLKYVGFTQLTKPQVMLIDPEIVSQITIKDFSYFYDRPFPASTEEENPLATTLFTLKGDRWRGLRYKMAPTFTSGKLKTMITQLKDSTDEIVSYLKQRRGPLDVGKVTGSYTLNVIGSVAFGLKVNAHNHIDGEPNEFMEMSQKLFRPSFRQFLGFILTNISVKLTKFLGLFGFDKDVTEFYVRLVTDSVNLRKKQSINRKDFLQLMMDIMDEDVSGRSLPQADEQQDENDKELLDNVKNFKQAPSYKFTMNTLAGNAFGFIAGGSTSTANSLEFLLYELTVNPKIKKRLEEEIDSVLSGKELDYATINSMTYLDNVINESLRKYPILFILRHCMQDYKIPGTNDYILKGESVVIPVLSMQNDPRYFPNPDVFDPDRFSDPDNIPKGTYLPFGAGPRFCIARRFALVKMKVFVAEILRSFDIKLNPKTRLPLKLKATPFSREIEGGLWIDFIPKN